MRIVALSDTHLIRPFIPDGDILIHAGDISARGTRHEIERELRWLASYKHPYKFYVPGNIDRAVQMDVQYWYKFCARLRVLLLLDRRAVVRNISLFGSPWVPEFKSYSSFTRSLPERNEYWASAPVADIVVSHSPPSGLCDITYRGTCAGCGGLRRYITANQPKAVVCGHIHEAHGSVISENTRVYNVAIRSRVHDSFNPVTVFKL